MVTTARQMIADANARIPTVTPQQAHDRLEAGTCVMLDVREPTEWETHISGTIQVPRGDPEFQADPASPTSQPSAGPGSTADRVLSLRGSGRTGGGHPGRPRLTDVSNMAGGLIAWKDSGLPTVDAHADI